MNTILFCSQDPLLIKAAYGLLRDDGYSVEVAEHPAEAVRCFLRKGYDAVILDSRDIGLNAYDASVIIKNIRPDTAIFVLGGSENRGDLFELENPHDLAEVKKLLRDLFHNRHGSYQKGGLL